MESSRRGACLLKVIRHLQSLQFQQAPTNRPDTSEVTGEIAESMVLSEVEIAHLYFHLESHVPKDSQLRR